MCAKLSQHPCAREIGWPEPCARAQTARDTFPTIYSTPLLYVAYGGSRAYERTEGPPRLAGEPVRGEMPEIGALNGHPWPFEGAPKLRCHRPKAVVSTALDPASRFFVSNS